MEQITRAFRQLRKTGIIARQNGTWAKMPKDGSWVYSVVRDDAVVINYGPPTVEHGLRVCAALRAEGLQVEWDQNPARTIRVQA